MCGSKLKLCIFRCVASAAHFFCGDGKMEAEKKLTGYPSIDKPWLKYYTEEAINAPLPECTIYEYLWENNKDHLDDVALIYFGKKITYGELFKNIDNTARAFSAIGVKQGDIVVMATVTTPEMIYAFYALNRLGAIPNMVDPRTSIDGIKNYIIEVGCKCVFVLDVAYEKIEKAVLGTNVIKIIVTNPADSLAQPQKVLYHLSNRIKKKSFQSNSLGILWKVFIKQHDSSNTEFTPYKKDTCCVIVHTGGTTGMPKGVMLSNENLNEMVISFKYNGTYFDRGNTLLSIMPPFIAYGIVNGVHMVLCRGMKIVLIPEFNPIKMADLILKYRPTNMLATPTHYDYFMSSKRIKDTTDLSFIKMVGIGGDGLHIDNEKRLNEFFTKHNCPNAALKGYGMTEVSAAACSNIPANTALGSVGLPFVKVIISAFEPRTDKELKYGEIGEICICSPSTMLGYYGNPEETKNILRIHSDGKVWVHSGDIGYINEEGNVYIESRIKRVIIRYDGFKVFPLQIEKAVMKCADVENCCAVGVSDKSHSQGKLPFVFAVKKKECSKSNSELADELIKICRDVLPEYEQPNGFKFIEKLPLTPIGKVDYRVLEQQAEQ